MLSLFWNLFVIAVSITFIILCFKAIGLIKRELGLGAAVVFTIGLLSTCSNSNNSVTDKQPNQTINVKPITDTLMALKPFKQLNLQNNLTFSIDLTYRYAVNKITGEVKPAFASSQVHGFSGAIDWVPENVIFETANSGKALYYLVSGAVKWKLFNADIVTRYKNFEGVINIDSLEQDITRS